MSPVIRATAATLAGFLNTISCLSGGSNGPAVTDFNNKTVNILPPLPGLNKVGVVPVSILDEDRHQNPLCDVSNDEIPDAACRRPREIMTSVFYPACLTSDNEKKPVLLDEHHFAPLFTPPILEKLYLSAGHSTHLHNLMTQAVGEAPSCKGQYPVVIFAPTAGGQRQAYTQAASELASLGHVVLTVDYPYLSGAIEGQFDQTVQVSTFGDWIHADEASLIQKNDLQLVYSRVVNESQPLSGLPFWTNDTTVQLGACIFGHGSGGQVAQNMVDTHAIKCGGPLEGVLALPAPFNSEETANNTRPSVRPSSVRPSSVRPSSVRPSSVRPSSPHSISQDSPLDLSPPTMYGLFKLLVHFRDSALETFGLLVCAAKGTCGFHGPSKRAPVQKRSVGDDPWYFPQKPYPKDPCYDGDYSYEDDRYEHDSGCHDDKWDGDYDGHYEDDYDYDDPCEYRDPYDPCDRYDRPYRPSKPFPPPGIFPPNITWPPYGDGKIDYNQPWDDHWDDYHNHGGDYGRGGDHGRKYGHKDCDHYDGGYDEGYEGDHDDDYHCDHYPDHYREWDKKQHCHGYVDDHDDDDYYDHDDDDYDDDYDGHDDDDYDDYEEDDCGDNDYDDYDDKHEDDYGEDDHHGDCHENHHDHGHVDDHHDEEHKDGYGEDYDKDDDSGYDHGYVDDWDNGDHAFKL